jgi:hypothetical protein
MSMARLQPGRSTSTSQVIATYWSIFRMPLSAV